MDQNIFYKTAIETRDQVRSGKIRAADLAHEHLQRVEILNPTINAYTAVNKKAVAQAEAIDQMVSQGKDPGPLAGVPFIIKDMLCTKGIATTAGSKMLAQFVPPYSATVVERLEAAGAIVLGKANQDEFAMGSSNETSFFGVVKNPWNLEHVPGGSSGGSAAAVAAGMACASIGTDTGGSIRQPANFCNLVGVKPTYGRVSRYGIIAYASSLDQAGPMTRTVADAAQIMEVICGKDERDATSSKQPVPKWSQNLGGSLKGMKIGLPKEYFSDQVSDDTKMVVDNALKILKEAGAETVEVSIPLTSQSVSIYYLIATSEASSNLARYDGVRYGHRADFSKVNAADLLDFYSRNRGEGFGKEVKRRIMIGTYALSSGYYDAYYKKACQVRRLLRQEFIEAFEQCDVMVTPVTTHPAFRIGERYSDPLKMYLNDIFTTSTNLAGLPGMSLPGGFSKSGLPIGVQLTAGHFQEEKMLKVAYSIEQVLNLSKRIPNGI